MKKIVLSMVVLAAMVSLLEAAPFQTLGLLKTPDAYVLPHKSAELVLVGYYRNVNRPDYVANEGVVPYGMIGVGLFDRVELGFFAGDNIYFMNAKVKLIQETLNLPQVSIGMDNIFSTVHVARSDTLTPINSYGGYAGESWVTNPDRTDYEHYSPYLVLSKQAVFGGFSWMFNLGIGQNRFVGQVPRSRWFSGSFASIEVSPFRNFAVQGEFDGKDFNAGVKYSYKNFTFKLCGESVEDWAKESEVSGYENNTRVAFGISYIFDKYAESKRIRPDIWPAPVVVTQNQTTVNPNEQVPVTTVENGTEVATITPGTTIPNIQNPEIIESTSYKELSPEIKELLAELKNLRDERQKAQKALEDLRKWLQELKEQNNR